MSLPDKVIIKRIYQPDLALRSMKVFVDGIEAGEIMPGQQLETVIAKETHSLKVKIFPYSSNPLTVDNTNIAEYETLYAGLFYKNVFESLSPRSLKLLSKKDYEQFNKKPVMTVGLSQLLVVMVSGIITGSLLIYFSKFSSAIKADSEWLFLLGLSAIIGSISVYFFRKIQGSTFIFYKPFFDAGSIVISLFLVDEWSMRYILLILIVALMIIGFIGYKSALGQK
jgi:hypothetical protein